MAQEQTNNACVCGHGSSSFESVQHGTAGSVSTRNKNPVNRASSSPVSSPPLLSSVSFPLPSSPTRTSPSVNNPRVDLAETSLPQFGSNGATTNCTDLQDHSDSESSREVGGPFDLRHAISKSSDGVRSADNDHSALQPSPAEAPISERSEESFSWTKERLRSKPVQAVKAQQDHSAEGSQYNYKDEKWYKEKSIGISRTIGRCGPYKPWTSCRFGQSNWANQYDP